MVSAQSIVFKQKQPGAPLCCVQQHGYNLLLFADEDSDSTNHCTISEMETLTDSIDAPAAVQLGGQPQQPACVDVYSTGVEVLTDSIKTPTALQLAGQMQQPATYVDSKVSINTPVEVLPQIVDRGSESEVFIDMAGFGQENAE